MWNLYANVYVRVVTYTLYGAGTGRDDGSEAAVATLSDRTVRLFVGRAPATPEKPPFHDTRRQTGANMADVKTAQTMVDATHLPGQSDTGKTAQARRDVAAVLVPAACGRAWDELSTVEREAALGLGWTPQLWKNLWTVCQQGQPLTLVPEPELTRTPNRKCDAAADGTQDSRESTTKRRCVHEVGTMTSGQTASVSVQTLPVAGSFGVAAVVDLATACSTCSGGSAAAEVDTASTHSDCSPPASLVGARSWGCGCQRRPCAATRAYAEAAEH
jgi:hypothetical protein